MQIDRREFVASVLAMGLGISALKVSRVSGIVLSKEDNFRFSDDPGGALNAGNKSSWCWRFHSPDGKPVRIPNQTCQLTGLQVEFDGDPAAIAECKRENSDGALVRVSARASGGLFRMSPECRPILADEPLFITTSMSCAFSGTASFCTRR